MSVTPSRDSSLANSKLDAFSQEMRARSLASPAATPTPPASQTRAADADASFRDLLSGSGLKISSVSSPSQGSGAGSPAPRGTPRQTLAQAARQSTPQVTPPQPQPAQATPPEPLPLPEVETPDAGADAEVSAAPSAPAQAFEAILAAANSPDRESVLSAVRSALGDCGAAQPSCGTPDAAAAQQQQPLAQQAQAVLERCEIPTAGSPRSRGQIFRADTDTANAAFLSGLDMQQRPARVPPARPRFHLQEVVGPDNFHYVGNMPSPAAVASLRALWQKDALETDVRDMLSCWDRELRSNTEDAVRPLPGDDVCEAPPATSTALIEDKIKSAEGERAAAERRLGALLKEAAPTPSGKQQEWHEQGILSERWRIQEAEGKIAALQGQLQEAAAEARHDEPRPSRSSLTEPPPDAVRVSGPLEAINGAYVKHLGRAATYVRADGMILYSDDTKWGFAPGAQRAPLAISLRTKSSNPCWVWQWYERDSRHSRFICNKRIRVEAQAESMGDNAKSLVDMGFPASTVEEALTATAGSLEGALNILVQEGWAPSTPLTPISGGESYDAPSIVKMSSSSLSLDRRTSHPHGSRDGGKAVASPADELLHGSLSNASMSSNLPLPSFGKPPVRQMQGHRVPGVSPATPDLAPINITRVSSGSSPPQQPVTQPRPVQGVKSVPPPTPQQQQQQQQPLSLRQQMQLHFPQMDTNVIRDVVAGIGNDAAACRTALAQIAGTPPAPLPPAHQQRAKRAVLPGQPRPAAQQQRAAAQPTRQALPQFRVLPPQGVSFRRGPSLEDVETTFAGPRGGDIVSAQNIVNGFLQLENGFFVPMAKEGRSLMERVDFAEEALRRKLGKQAQAVAADATELHRALQQGRVNLAALLLDAGSSRDTADADGVTTLQMVETHPAFNATSDAVLSVVKRVSEGYLHQKDSRGRTALHRAAVAGKASLVLTLLQCGASPLDVDADLQTPLSLALDVKEMQRTDGESQEELFSKWQRVLRELATPETLNTCVDSNGCTVLHRVLSSGRAGRAALLLGFDASTTIRTPNRMTPLMLAVSSPDFMTQPKAPAVLGRLASDLVVNEEDASTGMTPLGCAALSRSAVCVEELLLRKANPLQKDRASRTPLHHAAANGLTAVAAVLAKACPPAAATPSEDGRLPLHDASQRSEFDAEPNLQSYRLLATPQASVARDKEGRTALHYAAKECCWNMASLLISLDKEAVNVQDAHGKFPYQYVTSSALGKSGQAADTVTGIGAEVIRQLLSSKVMSCVIFPS